MTNDQLPTLATKLSMPEAQQLRASFFAKYSKRQKAEGRGQKVYYWYVVVSALKFVLTFMAKAIPPTAVAQLQQRLSQPEGFHSYGEAQEWRSRKTYSYSFASISSVGCLTWNRTRIS